MIGIIFKRLDLPNLARMIPVIKTVTWAIFEDLSLSLFSMFEIQLMNDEPGIKIDTTLNVLVLTRRNIPSKPVLSNPKRLQNSRFDLIITFFI